MIVGSVVIKDARIYFNYYYFLSTYDIFNILLDAYYHRKLPQESSNISFNN